MSLLVCGLPVCPAHLKLYYALPKERRNRLEFVLNFVQEYIGCYYCLINQKEKE